MPLPSGGRRRVEENEMFVLRYYPQRQPCWDAVTDLGGYSVSVGRKLVITKENVTTVTVGEGMGERCWG